MRSIALQCVGRTGTAACPTTLLALRLGPGRGPAVAALVELLALWIRLWKSMDVTEKIEAAKAWDATLIRMQGLPADRRWQQASGTLQATVVTLLAVGWAKACDSFVPKGLSLALTRFGLPDEVVDVVRDI